MFILRITCQIQMKNWFWYIVSSINPNTYLKTASHFLGVLCVILMIAIGFTVPALAEDDLRYPSIEQHNPSQFRTYQPLRNSEETRIIRPRPRYIIPQRIEIESATDSNSIRRVSPARVQSAPIPISDVEKPPDQATIIITLIGDSWGVQLGQALRESLSSKPEIGIANKARSETGLVNTSLRDWPKFVKDFTASNERNTLTIMMIGSNDNQPIRDETGSVIDPSSDKWKEIYTKHVDDILNAFKEKKTPLIWVGAPITKLDKLNANLLSLNKIYRERAQNAGFIYIDTWEPFADSNGKYSSIGPDINGINVKLRLDDTVHFTKSGARKLAFFVEKDLNALLSGAALKTEMPLQAQTQPAPALAAIPPLQVPLLQVPLLQVPLPQTQTETQNAVPLPDATVLAPIIQKPEAGSIFQLSIAPIINSDKLAERTPPSQQKNTTTEVFEQGLSPIPKLNRADDFSWPRQ